MKCKLKQQPTAHVQASHTQTFKAPSQTQLVRYVPKNIPRNHKRQPPYSTSACSLVRGEHPQVDAYIPKDIPWSRRQQPWKVKYLTCALPKTESTLVDPQVLSHAATLHSSSNHAPWVFSHCPKRIVSLVICPKASDPLAGCLGFPTV